MSHPRLLPLRLRLCLHLCWACLPSGRQLDAAVRTQPTQGSWPLTARLPLLRPRLAGAAFSAQATAEAMQQQAAAAARQERERQKRRAAELLAGDDGEGGIAGLRAVPVQQQRLSEAALGRPGSRR